MQQLRIKGQSAQWNIVPAYLSALSFRLRDSAAFAALHLRHPLEVGFSRVPQSSVSFDSENLIGIYLSVADDSTVVFEKQALFMY